MITLKVTHLVPGNACHLQAVLENLHYGKKVEVINIYEQGVEKFVDYRVYT